MRGSKRFLSVLLCIVMVATNFGMGSLSRAEDILGETEAETPIEEALEEALEETAAEPAEEAAEVEVPEEEAEAADAEPEAEPFFGRRKRRLESLLRGVRDESCRPLAVILSVFVFDDLADLAYDVAASSGLLFKLPDKRLRLRFALFYTAARQLVAVDAAHVHESDSSLLVDEHGF